MLRVQATGPGWRVLAPLFDRSLVLAHEQSVCPQEASWISELGFILLHIDCTRRALSDSRPNAEGRRWAMAVLRCLASEYERVMTSIAEATRCASEALDTWYDLASSGQQQQQLLVNAFRCLSSVRVLRAFLGSNDTPMGSDSSAVAIAALCGALDKSHSLLERSINSLHTEGCDLSLSAANRPALLTARPEHWWWRCKAPCYVSGGCPLVG